MWQKVGFAPHPYFCCFFNAFIGFIEYNTGCGKKSTLRHTLKLVFIRGYEGNLGRKIRFNRNIMNTMIINGKGKEGERSCL